VTIVGFVEPQLEGARVSITSDRPDDEALAREQERLLDILEAAGPDDSLPSIEELVLRAAGRLDGTSAADSASC
jgi:hypothetical protein